MALATTPYLTYSTPFGDRASVTHFDFQVSFFATEPSSRRVSVTQLYCFDPAALRANKGRKPEGGSPAQVYGVTQALILYQEKGDAILASVLTMKPPEIASATPHEYLPDEYNDGETTVAVKKTPAMLAPVLGLVRLNTPAKAAVVCAVESPGAGTLTP